MIGTLRTAIAFLALVSPSLPGAAAEVSFADLETGRKAITDDAGYFDRMQPMEMAAKTGGPLAAATLADRRAECRRRYQLAVREFTTEEEAALRGLVDAVDPAVRTHYPKFAAMPWNFLKVADSIEGGLPHTRGRHIVFAESVCRWIVGFGRAARRAPLDKMDLLLHERMHVFQRAQPAAFDSLYKDHWGFMRAKSIKTCPWIVERQLLNPDALDTAWVFPILRPGGTEYIWPLCSFPDGPGPKTMRDFSTYAFHVTRDGDDFEVRQAADGRPKYSELLAVRAYREVFPLSTNIYHPHEAAADLFAQLVLFDSHLAPRMERAPREEKEKTFGPLRRWFRKILGDDPSNAKAGQRMDPMPDFARLWGGLPTCPACSRLETCSTKRLDFKISRTDWPGSPAAPLKTRRRT